MTNDDKTLMTAAERAAEEYVLAEWVDDGDRGEQHTAIANDAFSAGVRWRDENPAWVSVEDRLPQEEGWYLVCNDREECFMLWYAFGGWLYEVKGRGTVVGWLPVPTRLAAPTKEAP